MHIMGEVLSRILLTALVGMLILGAFLWLGPSIYGITFGEDDTYINFNQNVFNDGYYYLAGTKAREKSAEKSNAYLAKVNEAGEKIWDKELNGLGIDKFYAIEKTKDNNLLLTGYKSDYLKSNNSYLAKVTPEGEMKWELKLEDQKDNLFYDIVETEDSYFAVGMTRGSEINNSSGLLVEVDKSGEKINFNTYDKGEGVKFKSLIKVEDKLILAGDYLDNNYQQRGYYVKTEQNGEIISEHEIKDINQPMTISDLEYYNQSLLITGTYNNNLRDRAGYLAKYDLEGNQVWNQQLDDSENDYQLNALNIIDEQIVVAGKKYEPGLISSVVFGGEMSKVMMDNAYAAMYDLDGNLIWEEIYRAQESGGYYDISIFDQDHLILSGNLGDFKGKKKGYLNKIDLSGEAMPFDIQDADIF